MISVIVPIYGVERYIERCAKSLMCQTFNDIEFIFVNDCTKDNSITKLKNIVSKYPNRNINIINKENNEGLPQARRTGFMASKGEYIIHFDSDDWVDDDCIARMYESAIRNNSDIVISNYYENYANKEVIKKCKHFKTSSEGIDMLFRAEQHSGVWNKLVRREVYRGIEFPKSNMHEDLVTMVQLFSKAKKFSFVEKPLYHYNLANISSLTNTSYSYYRARDTYDNLKMIENYLKNNNLLDTHNRAFSNFTNTFKGSILFKKETRNIDWLFDLHSSSFAYIFSENRLPLYKIIFLYGAYKRIFWPFIFVDYLRKFLHK